MAKSDEVEVSVTLVDKVTGKAKKMKSEMNRTFDSMEQGSNKAQSSLSKLAGPLGVAGLGIALVAVGKKAIDAKSKFEKLELTFKTILGSSEKAKERMKELADFASSTPFKLEGIAQASKILETLTQGALSTGKGLRMVGDASAVAGVPMEELAVHVGRANDALKNNRPAGEAISRMQELGLITGETRGKIEELQKQAKGTEAWNVLQKSLEKNSGAMKDLSETFEGKLSTLMDKVDEFYRVLLNENAFTNMKGGLEDLIKLTEEWTQILGGNLTMIEKIQKKENKSFQELLTLNEAHIQDLKRRKALLSEMDANKRNALDVEIEKQEKLSIRLAKSIQAEAKANKEKEKSVKITKTLSKEERKQAEEAHKNSEMVLDFEAQKDDWRKEVRKSDERKQAIQEGELEGYNKKIEKERELAEVQAQERERQKEAEDAKGESDKKQEALKRSEETAKKQAKESEEQAKREKKLEKEKTQAYIDSITMKQKVGKTGFLFAKAMFGENKKLAITEAIVQGVLATQKALASAPYPMNLVNAGLVAGQTAFNVSKMRKAEKGANFQTNGPELLLVGDNAGGKENVSVTPVNTPNMNGPKGGEGGGSTINITVQGNADESTVEKMARMIEDAVRDKAVNFRTLDGQEIITV